ncbi:hypothetical protein D3P08_20835 [Paenibacillus nanensis]|uniref:Uncharacterized protein n=1 Tax=Paenibacillus nanensis TaxID=393251 RepID=A0A3A1UP15_9BACL|nr:hypothetical protein [Paenibacillus nanensis]RIX50298.1 hypothetical protein D3P08_20835 [Paenibacillus nanensis]
MKRNRTIWLTAAGVAGAALILVLVKAMAVTGHTNYIYIQHGPVRGGHGGLFIRQVAQHHSAAVWLAPVLAVMKAAALTAAIWLWSKARGILRFVCAVAAGFALMSLLSPVWGVLLMALLLIIQSKSKRDPSFDGTYYAHVRNAPVDRGSFLDEWERNAIK